ncbi:right-handed parallel beta-helix repeat-containing protein [Borrelia sp. A-FGy1]|uniref:right-handed parallel beta-helix repeat-containing protein n=1 Tax=Borrelia sp. A-FGy1 TaxID=2608247 RepID=UPI001E406E96|nr:right-handed parallel beta-helix repeat-containing protein [Borrelia sp. A-FGy1]
MFYQEEERVEDSIFDNGSEDTLSLASSKEEEDKEKEDQEEEGSSQAMPEDAVLVGGVSREEAEAEEEEREDDFEASCASELDIILFTDEGQIFDLTPYTDIASVTLERKIVDPTLKTASSVFRFTSYGLSGEFLNFLFFRKDDVFVEVHEGRKPLFKGILEKFFTREVLDLSKGISFTVNDYSSLLRFSFQRPVQFPVAYLPDWLYVYNPFIKDQSVLHLILEHTKLADLVDEEASEAILDRVPAVIIDEGEEVETIISALLYEFGYAYTFTGAGKLVVLPIWKSEVVKQEIEICNIDSGSYVLSKSSASSYDSNRIIWREGKFQSKEEGISKRRPLYSAPISVAGSGGSLYVAVLQKGVVYPDFADKVGNFVFQEYDPSWFDTAYKWDFTRREVWHNKYAINENLAIIWTSNLEARFNADSSIRLVHEEYYPTKARIWFQNTSSSQGSRYIYYFDIYGDVFYTTVKNVLQTDNASSYYAKRAEYATRFIFDANSAVRLFDFLTNLRVKGHTIVNFRSSQELELTDFVRLRIEEEELEHFFLILSKKISRFDMQRRFFEYEALTWGDYSHYDYITTSAHIGLLDRTTSIYEVIVAPFNYEAEEEVAEQEQHAKEQREVPHFRATGFKDEDILSQAMQFGKEVGVNRIRLLAGDFYIYAPLVVNNFELRGKESVFFRSAGFSKNMFYSDKSFKMSGFSICQTAKSVLFISAGRISEQEKPLEEYFSNLRFAANTTLRLCSVYGTQEEKRASIYSLGASFVYLKDMRFSCNLGAALQTEKVEKILLENVKFSDTSRALDIKGVSNINIINIFVLKNRKPSLLSGSNALLRGGEFKENRDAIRLEGFSSVRVEGVEFSSNLGVALHLVDVLQAKLLGNTFTENEVGLSSMTQDFLIRDIFRQNKTALVKARRSSVAASSLRFLDASIYSSNATDIKEEEVA